jgi:signal transduction histidine kinase
VTKIEALVNKAATLVDSKGKAIFPEFRNEDTPWRFDQTYLFAYDLKLNVLLVAAFPENEGKNQTGKTDAKGKLYHDEFVKVVQSKGAGWVSYMFPKPGQTEPSEKWSYVKAVNIDGTPGLIGAGFYPTE